ncbi:hypothetical protein Tco_0397698 [Tanacetum coccineum]
MVYTKLPEHEDLAVCDEFAAIDEEQILDVVMEELTFFLGLQVQQKEDGTARTSIRPRSLDHGNEEAADIMFDSLCLLLGTSKADLKLGLWLSFRVVIIDLTEAFLNVIMLRANLDRKSKQELPTAMASIVVSESNYFTPKQAFEIAPLHLGYAYVKKLIHVLKNYTDDNVADSFNQSLLIGLPYMKLDLLLSHYLPTIQDPKVNLEGTGGSQGDQVQSSNDRPHSGGNTSERAEGGLNLLVLHNTCTLLSQQVLDLQKAKDAQAIEILKLKTRIKKLEA